MINKFFTVEKRLTIAASKQHAAFAAGDVMVDWTALQIPKGASKLLCATALIRPKGDANPTDNNFAFCLVFSKTNTVSLGTANDPVAHGPSNDFIGALDFDTANYGVTSLQSTAIAHLGHDSANPTTPLIVQGDPTTGDNVGFDTIYVGMIANGSFDFTSINVINDADINSTEVTDVVMAGSSMDVREHFAVGDVLHAQDDVLLGTVKSITDAATGPITLTSATSGAGDATTVANGDTIYNINPIKIILGFEK